MILHVCVFSGGMQDYNYIYAGCMEITLEVACCKFPAARDLPSYWAKNKNALVAYLLMGDMGMYSILSTFLTIRSLFKVF